MSESLGSELSYGEPLGQGSGYPAESDTLSISDEREPTEAAEQLPDYSSDTHASSTVPDPQNDNRLSVVSATSLEPRRRTRHHGGRHSHIHRDIAHMLSVSARDAKELRRGLNAAYSKLDQSRERASHAEKLALDMLLRVREAEDEREKAMREASAIHEELGRYKALLDSAHGEIRRGQSLLQDQENLRYEAEATAARARDNARQMKQRRLIELAKEQGRKMGYNEGVQAGQRIGYFDGQGPDDGTKVYFNEGPRFREVFDESNYRLDNFDQPQPVQPNPSPPNDPGVLPLAPQATDPPYTGSQAQYDETPAIPEDTSTPPSDVPYTTPLRRVQRPPSSDSSSTTSLPAAPVPLRALSRAPPTMPTIPEVASTEVGSASLRSRSLRDSPRMHSYIQPAPQAPTHNDVFPSIVPHLRDPATFEPPPGSVSPLAPAPYLHNDVFPSIVHPLHDRADFEPPPGSVGASPQVSPHDVVFPSNVPAMQDHTAFEPPPGSVGVSPSLVPQAHDAVLSSFVPPPQDRATFQPPPGSVDEPATAPFSGHPQGPGEQPVYAYPSPRRGYDNFPNGNGVAVSEGIRSPVQERFASFPEATPSQVQGRHAGITRNSSSTVQENFPSAPEYPPNQARERVASTHSRRNSRTHAESVQLADKLRNPEYSTGVRPDGSTSRRDGPPKRRPIPQMPAPLAPQSGPNRSYSQGSQSSVRHRRPSEFDYEMPSDAGMSASPNNPAPLAPQSGPNRSYSQGSQSSVRHRRPSEFDYEIPSDAGMSASPNNPAPLAPQSAPNRSYSQGSQSSVRHRRPSEFDYEMPSDAGVSASLNNSAPLAPQSAPNRSYSRGSQSSVRHRRPSEFDYEMPSDTGMNASSNTPVDRHYSPPRVIPSLAERSLNRTPTQHSGAASRQSHGGQRSGSSTVRDSHPVHEPHPGPNTARDPYPAVRDPSQAAPHFMPGDPPAGQLPRSPRVHVQIPPAGYYAPDPASHLAELSPTAHDQMPPADMYSAGAAPSSSNPNVSNSPPSRYPPTLYNEPQLQQQSSRSADYQQGHTASSPTLPVPSRNSRATSHVMIPPPATTSRRNSYATRQGRVTDSPNTPTDALPIPPPSLSPHPSPATFARQIPPPRGAVTSSTPRRPTSPNPLPRSSSPAPLPRASSPAPLPVRSPSMRSAKMHRNASDVSLPGAPGSPYIHYSPNRDPDIAFLASASAERLTAPTR